MTCDEAFAEALRNGSYATRCDVCGAWGVRQVGQHECGGHWATVFAHPLEIRMRLDWSRVAPVA